MSASLPPPKNRRIDIESIVVLGDRRRKVDEEKMFALADDMRRHGLLQPIGVRELTADVYNLIWGEARRQAARYLGWKRIAARIYPQDTPDELLAILEIVENLRTRSCEYRDRDPAPIPCFRDVEPSRQFAGRLHARGT